VQPKPIIDLTGDSDDEELQKALSLSVSPHIDGEVGDTGSGNSFKKSERTDVDQSWALVPVSSQNNDTNMTTAQDDDLQRAMEASLNSSYNEHSDELWVPGRTRVDKTWSVVNRRFICLELTLSVAW
jgi:Ubiquitin interaction motif